MSEPNGITITIEQLEALAAELEATEQGKRSRLTRLIAAYARIIGAREPAAFTRRATEYSDEDGHYDSSYPPKQQYKDRSGPQAIMIYEPSWSKAATSQGFYFDWRATEGDGFAVSRDGGLYLADVEGTGHFGQYAAHPGDCQVQLAITWNRATGSDVTTTALEEAEKQLREKAFPLIAQRNNG